MPLLLFLLLYRTSTDITKSYTPYELSSIMCGVGLKLLFYFFVASPIRSPLHLMPDATLSGGSRHLLGLAGNGSAGGGRWALRACQLTAGGQCEEEDQERGWTKVSGWPVVLEVEVLYKR